MSLALVTQRSRVQIFTPATKKRKGEWLNPLSFSSAVLAKGIHMAGNRLKSFLFPKLTPRYLIRLALIALAAVIFFSWFCIPARIDGISMEPTYHNGSFTFCCRIPYLFHLPRAGDVVMIRMSGTRVMYLKRVVALPGEKVSFQNGYLYINGKLRQEDYVVTPSDWNLPPRKVKPGHVYVVGDNRNIPIEKQVFGQVALSRVVGKVLW